MKYAIPTIILLSLILLACSFEDKDTFTKRYKFYENIQKYSNNKIRVGVDPNKGLSCVANDFISNNELAIKIPKEFGMCPYFMFPFKFEITSWLMEINSIKESIDKEQKLGVFILTYYLLYFVNAPKDEIQNYIREKKLEQYYKLDYIDESIIDSFPKIMTNSATMDTDHYEEFNRLGYNIDKGRELENIFKFISLKTFNSEYAEILYPWMSNWDDFRWAYAIVMSRSLTVRVREYQVLDKIKQKEKYFTVWEKKNQELNNIIGKKVGAPCIIAFVDLCNHYQPKYVDLKDKKPIILDTVEGHYAYATSVVYHKGEEVTHSYSTDPTNAVLLLHYGFNIQDNIFNTIKLAIEDYPNFNNHQFNLCKELGCIESGIREPRLIPQTRFSLVRNRMIDDSLINYARIKFLGGIYDPRSIIKLIKNDQIISFQNEISSWIFYINIFNRNLGEEGKKKTIKSIWNAQRYRNKYKELEKNWKNEGSRNTEWRRLKTYENIYLLDISFMNILYRHLGYGIKNIISTTSKEIDQLKNKYLN